MIKTINELLKFTVKGGLIVSHLIATMFGGCYDYFNKKENALLKIGVTDSSPDSEYPIWCDFVWGSACLAEKDVLFLASLNGDSVKAADLKGLINEKQEEILRGILCQLGVTLIKKSE